MTDINDHPINQAMDRVKYNIYREEFEKWFSKNKLDDEYFTRNEMHWFAEQAWKAAIDLWFNKSKENHNDGVVI